MSTGAPDWTAADTALSAASPPEQAAVTWTTGCRSSSAISRPRARFSSSTISTKPTSLGALEGLLQHSALHVRHQEIQELGDCGRDVLIPHQPDSGPVPDAPA